ncbi:unnamed protein product [Allacma fusca]|uniref:Protein DPCD n=1 Tax=Allacma fusca TaxID=39272 RepID=A0A8J2J3Z0_9HEXA|nr:unnamed protein product [Allacma fusca]
MAFRPEVYTLYKGKKSHFRGAMGTKCGNGEKELDIQWFLQLSQASKSCLVSKAGIKRVHYKLPDGREMLEDWKMSEGKARELVGRYWRKKSIVGNHLAWDVEMGDSVQVMTESRQNQQLDQNALQPLIIRESNSNCHCRGIRSRIYR